MTDSSEASTSSSVSTVKVSTSTSALLISQSFLFGLCFNDSCELISFFFSFLLSCRRVRFSAAHEFAKPNDIRALNLMNHAARSVMHELDDVLIGFGESDEFSFLFRKSTDLYQRRESKIVSTVVSLFTSAYVYYWNDYFPSSKRPLYPPVFDGRAVLYPSEVEVKDYFAWRQADTHINNLFNTSFWALVEKGGMTPKAAEVRLSVSIEVTLEARPVMERSN